MSNIMEYKGFVGTVELDFNNKILCGKVKGANGALTYEAKNVEKLESAFHDVVDDYLASCENISDAPKSSYNGRLGVRISPDVHRIAVQCAREQGITLNKFVSTALKKAIREHVTGSRE